MSPGGTCNSRHVRGSSARIAAISARFRAVTALLPGFAPSRLFLCPRFSFHAVQDPSNNEQDQNHGNGKRVTLKYAHGAPPNHSKSAGLRGAARV
jgi:hypothetical protein